MTDKERIIEAARKSAAYQREIASKATPANQEVFAHSAAVMSAFADTLEADAY